VHPYPLYGDDVGVVDETVDGRGCDDVVAEGLSPAGEDQVRSDDHRPEIDVVVGLDAGATTTWSSPSASPFCWLGCARTYADDLMRQPTPNRSG
jgi:hypothetical protein